MIERFDPFGRAMSLRQMMERMLQDGFVLPSGEQGSGDGSAPLNVYEEGDRLIVEAQMPGIKPEDVEVTVEGGVLTIRGQMQAEEERKDRNYIIREHRRGTFVRSLRLPDTIAPDQAQARFENGVLRLSFPRSEAAKPKRISLSGNNGQIAGDGQSSTSGQTAGPSSQGATDTQGTSTGGQSGSSRQAERAA